MKMSNNTDATQAVGRVGWPALRATAAFLVLLMTAFAALAYTTSSAYAGNGDARFVRIGLDKSIVVRLPAEAHDVLIGNPEVVDAVVRTRKTAYLFARKVGQTNAFFFDAAGRQILSLDIEVAHDTKGLQQLLQRSIPGNQITVDTVGENVVLGGVAANAAQAKTAYDLAARFAGDKEKVMTMIKVTGKDQVMLKVRIAELQRDVVKQFGIDTDVAFEVGSNFAARLFNPIGLGLGNGLINGNFAQGAFQNGNAQVDAIVRALEQDGLLRTLAEPTLTAISGESAKFLAGGEFPVPVGADNNEITIEFKPFGVGLGFTPVVLSEGRISLRISTEISELTSENNLNVGTFAIPGLRVRRAETTVEMPSGGSMVLAGLIKDEVKQSIIGVPGVKDLPVLGALFRSRDYQANQTEMVAIVTAYMVNPVQEKQLATPIDRLNVATDRQTILFGRLNKVYGVAGDRPKGTYHGNVGFIVE
jgi:pilus assembly protein CpaC